MTILLAVGILGGAILSALLVDRGLPELMRRIALWLVVRARQIDARRSRLDAEVRQGLAGEAGCL